MEKEILVQFRVPAKGKMKSLNVICFPMFRSSRPGVFLGKGVQKTCSKFAGEHPFRSLISIKLQSDFIEMTLQNGRSPVNLLHIFRTAFPKNTSKLGSCFRMFPKLYEGFYNIIPFSVKKLIIIVTNQIFSKVSKSDYGTPIKVKKMLQTIGKFFFFFHFVSLRIWSHLLKNSLMDNFIFYAVLEEKFGDNPDLTGFQSLTGTAP